MVVAAGDHRDDTSGVTAALDPDDEREHHEGNGHDPLPVPADVATPEPMTGALPAVPGDEQPALERGAEAAPPSVDVDDRRGLPAAVRRRLLRPATTPVPSRSHRCRRPRRHLRWPYGPPRPSVRHRHRPRTR